MGARWSAAEVGYIIEHWADQDTSCAEIAAAMALATGRRLRTEHAVYSYGSMVLRLGPRPKKWTDDRKSEVKRLLFVEGLTLKQAGDVLGISKNAVVSVKNQMGLCTKRPSRDGPYVPRTQWAGRPFPGVVVR